MSGCCQTKSEPVAKLAAKPSSCCGSSGAPSQNGSQWAALGILILLSGLSMNVSLAVNLSSLEGNTRLLLHGGLAAAGIVAFVLGGADLLRPAWQAILERRVVTEHLFLAGIAAAWGVSVHATLIGSGAVFYEVPILLPAIRRFGSILLGRQRGTIESAMQELFAGVATARIWKHGNWQTAPLSAVAVGDRLLVRAAETIPADSTITVGRAYVQTGSLTGEPFPVALEPGGRVTSGMLPMDGALEMEVRALPAASALSHIANSTRELLERPPAFLRSVEKVLRWFFPTVLSVSVGTLLFWSWYDSWQVAISHSLAVVLVACPCAFGMALPLLFRRGLASCLQRGIEPTDAAFMESLSMARLVAFDKTGTLTHPEMSIGSLYCAPDSDESEVRAVLAALHGRSNHPVARPFWEWAAEAQGIEVEDLVTHPGRGVEARILLRGCWQTVRLGNQAFLSNPPPVWARIQPQQRHVFVEISGILCGVCVLDEQLRSSVATTCHHLEAGGWQLAVITGDAAIPRQLSSAVAERHVSQTPSQKAGIIASRESSGTPVLFLGDGVNDATALATATASIAVGDAASFAGASAQARWLHPDFATLPGLLEEARSLSGRAHLIMKTALTYNFVGMALAAAGLLHPVAAAVVMLVSSATVMTLASRRLGTIYQKDPKPALHPATP
ncbi:MAG: HAD-IC family P-type ATPase [Akkermansiaceae bacterium]